MKVSVIGSGVMGKGIVEAILSGVANKEISVTWISRRDIECDRFFKQIFRKVNKARVRKGIETFSEEDFKETLNVSKDYSDIIGSNFVIEAISEILELKSKLFAELSDYTNEETIIATNTSSLSITELASSYRYSENVIGMHFFNPAPMMKLVEVVCGLRTSDTCKDKTVQFLNLMDHAPVLVKESPGFIVNRLLMPMINESISLLSENIASREEIDKAMLLGANHPMGPLALADLIGIDTVYYILDTLYQETGHLKYKPHPLLKKMLLSNMLGKKSGEGFYNY